MSELLDRLLCASANGVRAPIDADDLHELVRLYEISPDRHPSVHCLGEMFLWFHDNRRRPCEQP